MKSIKIDLSLPIQEIEIKENSTIEGRFMGKDSDNLKSKTIFIHKLPNIVSRINIKAVVFDNSRFDFEGLLRIAKGATGTDTYLKIDCLVVGENAYARAIPSLEILESEVKGGHGATIGYLDPLQIYYLRSRGFSISQAENILINAFLS